MEEAKTLEPTLSNQNQMSLKDLIDNTPRDIQNLVKEYLLRGESGALLRRISPPKSTKLEGHTAMINSVAITPDAARAITGSIDKTARLWDLKIGENLKLWHIILIMLKNNPANPPENAFYQREFNNIENAALKSAVLDYFKLERSGVPSAASASQVSPDEVSASLSSTTEGTLVNTIYRVLGNVSGLW